MGIGLLLACLTIRRVWSGAGWGMVQRAVELKVDLLPDWLSRKQVGSGVQGAADLAVGAVARGSRFRK